MTNWTDAASSERNSELRTLTVRRMLPVNIQSGKPIRKAFRLGELVGAVTRFCDLGFQPSYADVAFVLRYCQRSLEPYNGLLKVLLRSEEHTHFIQRKTIIRSNVADHIL